MAAKITVRELVTKLTIGGNATDKLARFGLAMNGVKAGLGIMVGAMKLASRATLGLVDDVTKMGDSIAKTAGQTGVAAKSLQRLSFTADRSGASMRGLRKGLQNIAKNLRDAEIAAGKGKGTGFTKALADIGLGFKDLQDLSPERQLGLLGDALNSVADKSRRMAISQKLLGERSGPNLAQLLAEGTDGIKALGDEAERLGLVMSGKALKASEDFQDRMTDLRSVLKGLKTTIGVSLIPIVEKAVKKFTEWLVLNRKFITSKFENGVKFLTRAFAGLINNLDEIVGFFEDLTELASDVLDFFNNVADAVGGLETLIRLATAAWVTYRISAIAATVGLSLTPLGLLFTALGLIALAFSDIGRTADDARVATSRFNNVEASKGNAVDNKSVAKDSRAIAKRISQGKGIGSGMRSRLATMNSLQLTQTMDAARALVKSASGKQAAGQARQGFLTLSTLGDVLSGNNSAVESRIRATIEASDATRGRPLSALDALESDIARERRDESLLDFAVQGAVDATGRSKRATRGGGRSSFRNSSGTKADEPADKSFEELMAEAIRSGQLPEAAALLTSTQPPIIITNTNNIITVEVDATSVFEGVPGENATEFSDRAVEFLEEFWGRKMRDGMDQLKPQLAR